MGIVIALAVLDLLLAVLIYLKAFVGIAADVDVASLLNYFVYFLLGAICNTLFEKLQGKS